MPRRRHLLMPLLIPVLALGVLPAPALASPGTAALRQQKVYATSQAATRQATERLQQELGRLGPAYFARFATSVQVNDVYTSQTSSQRLAPVAGTRVALDAQGRIFLQSGRDGSYHEVGGVHTDLSYGLRADQRGRIPDAGPQLLSSIQRALGDKDRQGRRGVTRAWANAEAHLDRPVNFSELTTTLKTLGLDQDALTLGRMNTAFARGPIVLATTRPGRQDLGPNFGPAFHGTTRLTLDRAGTLHLELAASGAPPRQVDGAVPTALARKLFHADVRTLIAKALALPTTGAGRGTFEQRSTEASQLASKALDHSDRTFRRLAAELLPAALASGKGERAVVNGDQLLYLEPRKAGGQPWLAVTVDGRPVRVDKDRSGSLQVNLVPGRLSPEQQRIVIRGLSQLSGSKDGAKAVREIRGSARAAERALQRESVWRDVGAELVRYQVKRDLLSPKLIQRLAQGEVFELGRVSGEFKLERTELWSLGNYDGGATLLLTEKGLSVRATPLIGRPAVYPYAGTISPALVRQLFPKLDVAAVLKQTLAAPGSVRTEPPRADHWPARYDYFW